MTLTPRDAKILLVAMREEPGGTHVGQYTALEIIPLLEKLRETAKMESE